MELGLRHQGVLISSVRGCDTAERHDASKMLSRCLRAEILNAHVGDAKKSKSFIEKVEIGEMRERMKAFLNALDHYPIHFVMHFIHAAEIVGYCHPNLDHQLVWKDFYEAACRRLHVNPETLGELNARLNAAEEEFAAAQNVDVPPRHPTDLREVLASTSVKSFE